MSQVHCAGSLVIATTEHSGPPRCVAKRNEGCTSCVSTYMWAFMSVAAVAVALFEGSDLQWVRTCDSSGVTGDDGDELTNSRLNILLHARRRGVVMLSTINASSSDNDG